MGIKIRALVLFRGRQTMFSMTRARALSSLPQALALIAIGVAPLMAGQAKANVSCTFAQIKSSPSTCSATVGDLTFSNFAVTGTPTGIDDGDTFTFSRIGTSSTYQVFGNYSTVSSSLFGSGSFNFDVSTSSQVILKSARLDTAGSNFGSDTFIFTNTLTGPPALVLTSTNGSDTGFQDLIPPRSSTTVTVEWSRVSGSGLITNSTLNLTTEPVPAPLPLLGAAAAFGYSRKLRRRMRAPEQH